MAIRKSLDDSHLDDFIKEIQYDKEYRIKRETQAIEDRSILVGDIVKVVKGRTLTIGSLHQVKDVKRLYDKYARPYGTYLHFTDGTKINENNCEVVYYLKYDEMKSHGIKICSNFSNYDKDKILFEFENTRIYATFARMYKTSISMTSIKSLIDE